MKECQICFYDFNFTSCKNCMRKICKECHQDMYKFCSENNTYLHCICGGEYTYTKSKSNTPKTISKQEKIKNIQDLYSIIRSKRMKSKKNMPLCVEKIIGICMDKEFKSVMKKNDLYVQRKKDTRILCLDSKCDGELIDMKCIKCDTEFCEFCENIKTTRICICEESQDE